MGDLMVQGLPASLLPILELCNLPLHLDPVL